jgi:hypothetical protein
MWLGSGTPLFVTSAERSLVNHQGHNKNTEGTIENIQTVYRYSKYTNTYNSKPKFTIASNTVLHNVSSCNDTVWLIHKYVRCTEQGQQQHNELIEKKGQKSVNFLVLFPKLKPF